MNIYQYFHRAWERHPDKDALFAEETLYSYREVGNTAAGIASALESAVPYVGLLAQKSLAAYAGVLGILRAGKAYVPLNYKFPVARNQMIMELSGMDTLVLGKEALETAVELLPQSGFQGKVLLCFDQVELPENIQSLKGIEWVALGELPPPAQGIPTTGRKVRTESPHAYLLFTSGSTGIPKGVPISHENVAAYVDYLQQRYQIQPEDRFSQTFDLTFDLSVHDMFLCWSGGASLYAIPQKAAMAPARFIRKHALTCWFSVPSVGMFMQRFRMLKPGTLPSLRLSLFCGEPLPAKVAEAWQSAADQSILENIYGPTEATIGITHYRWRPEGPNDIHNGIVSIGQVFATQDLRITDAQQNPLPPGEIGELHLGGSQVCAGYWNNPEKTAAQFVQLPGEEGIWYATGDLVQQNPEGQLLYISRKDFQVKIRGFRVELEEISHQVQEFTGAERAVSIAWPVENGIAEGVYTFLTQATTTPEIDILEHCRAHLPEYMIPKGIIFVPDFPLSANGKIDQRKLTEWIT